jgi:hypothetical protein
LPRFTIDDLVVIGDLVVFLRCELLQGYGNFIR